MQRSACLPSSRRALALIAAVAACAMASCNDGGDDDAEDVDTTSSTSPARPTHDAAAPRPHHTKFIVACDSRLTMNTCTEYLSDTGDPELIKRSVKQSCSPQFSDYREERCPTEQLVGRCLEKTRVGFAQLDRDQQASLMTFHYAPITAENSRARCHEGMHEPHQP